MGKYKPITPDFDNHGPAMEHFPDLPFSVVKSPDELDKAEPVVATS